MSGTAIAGDRIILRPALFADFTPEGRLARAIMFPS